MAAMSTTLVEFADNGNSRTYTLTGHTALKPRLVIQKRRVPSGNQKVVEDTVTALYATEDDDGFVLAQKVSFAMTVRRPIDGQAADVTALLAIIRDVIAGDEYTNVVNTQEFLV